MPTNFYQLVPPFFHEFWTMEFRDASVNYAFFANITSKNCIEFGLPAFAEKPSSLAVINVRRLAAFSLLLVFFPIFICFLSSSHPSGRRRRDRV